MLKHKSETAKAEIAAPGAHSFMKEVQQREKQEVNAARMDATLLASGMPLSPLVKIGSTRHQLHVGICWNMPLSRRTGKNGEECVNPNPTIWGYFVCFRVASSSVAVVPRLGFNVFSLQIVHNKGNGFVGRAPREISIPTDR